MTFEAIIEQYGYAALFFGTILEGETILILAGFAAHRGLLSLPWVIVVAFLGSFAGDQMWFLIGRRYGRAFIARRPKLALRSERVHAMLTRHEYLVVFGFRFVYGTRTVTPLLLGASNYSPWRFLVLNAIGAAVWSAACGVAGYLFGNATEVLLGDVKHYERWLFVGLAGGGIAFWLFRRWQLKRRLRQQM